MAIWLHLRKSRYNGVVFKELTDVIPYTTKNINYFAILGGESYFTQIESGPFFEDSFKMKKHNKTLTIYIHGIQYMK